MRTTLQPVAPSEIISAGPLEEWRRARGSRTKRTGCSRGSFCKALRVGRLRKCSVRVRLLGAIRLLLLLWLMPGCTETMMDRIKIVIFLKIRIYLQPCRGRSLTRKIMEMLGLKMPLQILSYSVRIK